MGLNLSGRLDLRGVDGVYIAQDSTYTDLDSVVGWGRKRSHHMILTIDFNSGSAGREVWLPLTIMFGK